MEEERLGKRKGLEAAGTGGILHHLHRVQAARRRKDARRRAQVRSVLTAEGAVGV